MSPHYGSDLSRHVTVLKASKSLSENKDCIRIKLSLRLTCPSEKHNLKSHSCSLGCTSKSRGSLPSAHTFLQHCLVSPMPSMTKLWETNFTQHRAGVSILPCSTVASCAIRSHLVSAFQYKEFLETAKC